MKVSIILSITFLLFSCNGSRVIEGKITAIKSNTVTIDSMFLFKVDTTGLYVGKNVSFTPTVNRKIINSKRLK